MREVTSLPHAVRQDTHVRITMSDGVRLMDTDPFTERCEILGAPVLELCFASTAPVAMVAVRLSDVAADGRATRISYGLLNLTHHKGTASPTPSYPASSIK
jgi:uncharacterized protein